MAELAILIVIYILFFISFIFYGILWINRKWPPLITKMVPLLGIQLFLGLVWSHGFAARPVGFLLPSCFGALVVAEVGLWFYFMTISVRWYRLHKVLVKHSADMWPSWAQMLITLPLGMYEVILASIRVSAQPNIYPDIDGGFCPRFNELPPFPEDGSGFEFWQPFFANSTTVFASFLLIGFLVSSYYALKLSRAREQFRTSSENYVALAIAFTGFIPGFDEDFLSDSGDGLWYAIVSQAIFWGFAWEPLYHLWKKDEAYLHRFTYGYSTTPTPEQLKNDLGIALTIPEFKSKFRTYAGTRYAEENVDFYEDVLKRNEMIGWFDKQAQTTKMISRYIEDNAPHGINIAHKTKKDILEGDINNPDLFSKAAAEVYQILINNLELEFQGTESFKNLHSAAEAESRELSVLNQAGLVPKGVVDVIAERSSTSDARRSSIRNQNTPVTSSRSLPSSKKI